MKMKCWGKFGRQSSIRHSYKYSCFKDKSGEAVLKQIAAENDGTYRFVQN